MANSERAPRERGTGSSPRPAVIAAIILGVVLLVILIGGYFR